MINVGTAFDGSGAAAAARRLVAVVALLLAGWLTGTGPVAAQDADRPAGVAVLMEVDGPIGPATTDYLERGLADARERGAEIAVIRMDTPGGLSSSTRDIVRAILGSPVPVAVYVAPGGARAASAGTYILYASGLAAMAPATNLGAATPIPLGGGGSPLGGPGEEDDGTDGPDGEQDGSAPGGAAGKKAVNDAVAFMRSLAELNDRSVEFAEKAVREASSLSAGDALDQNVIEIIAEDLETLLAEADGRTVRTAEGSVTLETAGIEVVPFEADWRSELLAIISNPNIAYILMLIGIYGIIFELASPGAIFPGVIGAISLVTALFALNLIGVDYAGAGLILLGIALMVAEAFAPSFGILGIGGAIAFGLGSLFIFDEAPGFEVSLPIVVAATAISGGLLAIVLAAVIRAQRRGAVSGGQALIGARGRVLDWSGTSGEVHVHGERWRARGSVELRPGDEVEVTARDELTLEVRPAASPQPT